MTSSRGEELSFNAQGYTFNVGTFREGIWVVNESLVEFSVDTDTGELGELSLQHSTLLCVP